jgi:hypothetical protein
MQLGVHASYNPRHFIQQFHMAAGEQEDVGEFHKASQCLVVTMCSIPFIDL